MTKATTQQAKKARKLAAQAAQEAKNNQPRQPKRLAARPWALGGHAMDASPNGSWQCRCCRVRAKKWNDIAPKRCGGSAAAAWAKAALALSDRGVHASGGHQRMLSGELVWCIKCGAYGDGKAIGLRLPCTGNPRASWSDGQIVHNATGRATNLWLLKANRHPQSRLPLPTPVPEFSWSESSSATGIQTAVIANAARPKPREDILERIKRKEAAAKELKMETKRKNSSTWETSENKRSAFADTN